MIFDDPTFLLAVLQIIWIDLLLSGDNAVVIALACRNLPANQRLWGLVLGTLVAITMRIGFAGVVTTLMTVPYVKIFGGLLLVWIAIKLLSPDCSEENDHVECGDTLWRAVRIIAVADIVMSLDNVIAIAAAARGSMELLVFGLIVSIPLIMAGAAIVMAAVERFPIVVWAGGALLGWIAGEIIVSDPFIAEQLDAAHHHNVWLFGGLIGAAAVLSLGYLRRRHSRRENPDLI
ncbi:TerC family protein [Methyloligella sp. 2.7D]|uniref:TerC family protein n=1 Tax=unclassified Methyloligella TaxID=2625955 RepID=UPI00157D1ADA|nr:TerC family protein [Methyloligella sp. GL2]QKP77629.1 TerC family protein [Methyloligella sp. GL2]